MTSREKILAAVKNSQPAPVERPVAGRCIDVQEEIVAKFSAVLESIGGVAIPVAGFEEIAAIVREKFAAAKRVLSNCPELAGIGQQIGDGTIDPHSFADTDLAILRGHFGVAENGAVWWTEDPDVPRVLPFICQHLALVIDKKNLVPTMREAYEWIGEARYDFGVFIAGPSKTADIEQSLVLGAHGPVSMTVFIVDAMINR